MRIQQNTIDRSQVLRPAAAQTSAATFDTSAAVTAPGRGGRSGERIHLTRRGRLVLLGLPAVAVLAAAAAGLVLLLGVMTNQAQASAQEQPGVKAEEITVAPGETLWSVAAAADSEAEIQETIARIAELNELGSSELQPGQTLHIPAD